MSNSHVTKAIANELDERITDIQKYMDTLLSIEISYVQASRILARKVGLYTIPLNEKEIKELEKLIGKKIKK